jgi:hypothetical protein
MSVPRSCHQFLLAGALLASMAVPALAQPAGTRSITAEELRLHLTIVASDETEGRNTPSTAGDIVARYLATMAAHEGLKPLMPDGSFFQDIPLNVTTVSESQSRLLVRSATEESVFFPARDFGGNVRGSGTAVADIVFVGCGLRAPASGWDDFTGLDLKGKVVVALEGQLPAGHALATDRILRATRQLVPAAQGAAAVLTVISPERERDLQSRGAGLSPGQLVSLPAAYPTQSVPSAIPPSSPTARVSSLPIQAEIRHDAATRILGISRTELDAMFASLAQGRQVPGRTVPTHVELSVVTDTRRDRVRNVLAFVEGSDPVLKNEYVVISSHYDHLGMRSGRSLNGADDDGSGTVAMLEIAQALMVERPKRSVILAWFAGEEKGMWGSHHFVNNSPVPVEAISANLNLDMISRNDPNGLFLVAVNNLSTELDGILRNVGERSFGLSFDYTYNDKTHPDRFYYRSDHYPFVRMGVPGVWLFCGTTPDYHQVTDTIERVDFGKMEKITRFAYAAAIEIGNRPGLLKLDVDPLVTVRGKQNTQVESIR